MIQFIGNKNINNKFDISRFIYSKRRFHCFMESLSSSLLKCLQFQIFYTDFNRLYVINKTKDTYLLSNKSSSTEVVFVFKLGVFVPG